MEEARRNPGEGGVKERALSLDQVPAIILARLTNPEVRAVGVALNTSKLSAAEAERLCAETADALGLPCTDPFSMGVDPIIDWITKCFEPSPRKATLSL